jgi:hypothetical protein
MGIRSSSGSIVTPAPGAAGEPPASNAKVVSTLVLYLPGSRSAAHEPQPIRCRRLAKQILSSETVLKRTQQRGFATVPDRTGLRSSARKS